MNGYLAFLDVLGFKSLIAGENVDQRLQDYLGALEKATTVSGVNEKVEYLVFSDSIVLTAGDSTDSFGSLLVSCSRLLGIMLEKSIPIRGALTYGTYLRVPSGNGTFVAGKAVIDAYQCEELQDWVGIILAPPAIGNNAELKQVCNLDDLVGHAEELEMIRRRRPWCTVLQYCNRIPFHREVSFDTNYYSGFAIVPTIEGLEAVQVRDGLRRCCESLERLNYLAPTPQTQRKIQETSYWLAGLEQRWGRLAQLEELKNSR